MVYDFQINEKNQLEEEYLFHNPKILDDSSSAHKPNKTLIQLGILKVQDLVFKRGQKSYNRKVYDLIQEIKTHLPKTQDRQPEQASKENSFLYISLEGKKKPTHDISMKQIYSELQNRVSINTPYKGKWEKILNEQNIDWVEIWNTVHQTTATLKLKYDIFSQIHVSYYCNYIHQKSDSNVTAMCNLCGGEVKTHCHEILSCKTMLDIVDHFRPIIPAIDSKAISRRESIFGLTVQIYEPPKHDNFHNKISCPQKQKCSIYQHKQC